MQHLIEQERFEIEALDRLNSARLLRPLAFGGGTMLRLCFGLDRYSVALDFWVVRETDLPAFFEKVKRCLEQRYTLTDAMDKFHTMVFQMKSSEHPRSLKIEIRKEQRKIATERAIAFSTHSTRQVLLTVVALEEMMRSKIEACVTRREIRDAFDIEFLLKRGVAINSPPATLRKVLRTIDAFTRRDYTVKLGSLIEPSLRGYYTSENFKELKARLHMLLTDRRCAQT